MKAQQICVVIPAINEEGTIGKIVSQACACGYKVIVVDDGSTDDSLAFARSIDDPRVRVISDGLNKGLPARLNEIVQEAKYDLIARMDADDLLPPSRISQQVEFLLNRPEIDLVTTGLLSMDDSKHLVGIRKPDVSEGDNINLNNLINGRCFVAHATIVSRKSWSLRNPYDESAKLMEDYQLWIDSFLKNDFHLGFIGDPLYYYRESSSVSKEKSVIAYLNQLELVKSRYKDKLGGKLFVKFLIRMKLKILVVRFLHLLGKVDFLLRLRSESGVDLGCYLQEFNTNVDLIDKLALPQSFIEVSDYDC